MSEGTSLEDIETGNVAHTADDAVMNAILSDMNAVETPSQPQSQQAPQMPVYIPPPQEYQPPVQSQPQYQDPFPSMPFMQPEPQFSNAVYQEIGHQPQYPQHQQNQQNQPIYEAVEESVAPPKKNSWSQLFDELRDPIVVGILVSLFSLPALHTWLAKRLTWAYKIGGSLSWIGFLIQFALVAGIFATYRQIMTVMGV